MAHFLHYFYAEPGQPWYHAQVWGNVVAVTVLAPAGYLWSRTKFWPLHAIHRKLDDHSRLHAEHAAKLDELSDKSDI